MKRIFLDASCWIAAAGSESGGSSAIVLLAQAELIMLLSSRMVLQEVERNLHSKMGAQALQRFYFLLANTAIEICEPTTLDEEAHWANLIVEKERHVLAAALKSKADLLVTLDRKHVLSEVVRTNFPIPVQDTKEFLTKFHQ